ncbi:hypothetical protein Tco_0390288 [Tanacetum coccineum]
MLEMMVEFQDARIMFKKNPLRVAMFRKRREMYKEILELLLLEPLQMFSATIAVRKKDEVVVILSNEHNYFLIVDFAQMEEIEKMSANICMMSNSANIEFDEGLSYDSAFISEVQTPSTSYMNPLFTNSNNEQTYLEQPKIINYTIGDDQINSDIIFDDLYVEVNNGSVKHDKHAHDLYELEQLARNAYKEAQKQQNNCSQS